MTSQHAHFGTKLSSSGAAKEGVLPPLGQKSFTQGKYTRRRREHFGIPASFSSLLATKNGKLVSSLAICH